MTELLKGGKRKNKTRGNGEERENRRRLVVAAEVGFGVGTELGTANSGAVRPGVWAALRKQHLELVMISVYIASTPHVGTIYYGQEDYRK